MNQLKALGVSIYYSLHLAVLVYVHSSPISNKHCALEMNLDSRYLLLPLSINTRLSFV
jgi:hypothetical protein